MFIEKGKEEEEKTTSHLQNKTKKQEHRLQHLCQLVGLGQPEENALALLKEDTVVCRPPHGEEEVGVVLVVVLANHLDNGGGGLPGAVKGNAGEGVVKNVGNVDQVELLVEVGAHGAVNSAERAPEPVPLVVFVVRHVHVRVLHIGDGHQEAVVHDERKQVETQDEAGPKGGTKEGEAVPPAKEAHSAGDHLKLLLLGENRGSGEKVAGEAVSDVPAGVDKEVEGPADEKHEDQLDENRDGVLDGLVGRRELHLAPLAGHKDLVLLQVVGVVVVVRVGVLPGKVRDAEGGVEDVANRVIDKPALRKGAMATLVGDHPHGGEGHTLHQGVGEPPKAPDNRGKLVERGVKVDHDAHVQGQLGEVLGQVVKGLPEGGLKAVVRNDAPEIRHSERRVLAGKDLAHEGLPVRKRDTFP